jgi:hypothetical protein
MPWPSSKPEKSIRLEGTEPNEIERLHPWIPTEVLARLWHQPGEPVL